MNTYNAKCHTTPVFSINKFDDPRKRTSTDHIGLKHVAIIDFSYYLLIYFGLRKYYHMKVGDFDWPELFENDISILFDRFSSIKCLSIIKDLVNA